MAVKPTLWGLRPGTMLGPLIAAAQATDGAPTLNIDLSKHLHSVSPALHGLITGEINDSYDGGLYPLKMVNASSVDRRVKINLAGLSPLEMG